MSGIPSRRGPLWAGFASLAADKQGIAKSKKKGVNQLYERTVQESSAMARSGVCTDLLRAIAVSLVREGLLGLAIVAERLGEATQPGQGYRVLHQLEHAGTSADGGLHSVCRVFWRHPLCARRVFTTNLCGFDREPDHGLHPRGPRSSFFDFLRS